MSQYWSDTVHSLTPYVPGEQPKINNLIKLNTNEHPFGPSPRVLEAIQSANNDTLRLYPDPNADALKAALAAHHHVTPSKCLWATAPTKCWRMPSWRCSNTPVVCGSPTSPTAFTPCTAGCTASTTAPSRWRTTSRFASKTTCHATAKPQAPSSSPTPTHPRAARCRWPRSSASWRATHKPWC